MPIKIASVYGLSPAGTDGKMSDVYVEVYLEGKAESKVKVAVIANKVVRRVGAELGERDVIEAELNINGELPNYAEGDKVVITVMDEDLVGPNTLGKAVVTDGKFGGGMDLEGVGEGHKAYVMVQLGDGEGMEQANVEFKMAL